MERLAHYEQLATLFDYPERDYPAWVREAYEVCESRYPLAAAELEEFAKALPSEGETFSTEALDEVQEIFTRSFDVQSITTLGVGYVMFGDDYKRGELLVNLSGEHLEAGVDCGSELPDHLPNVLRLMSRWQDRELVVEFVEEVLHPALERMTAEFAPKRMEQRNALYRKHFKTLIASSAERGSIFRRPLAALLAVLRKDFDLSERERPEPESDFLRSVGRELDIEANEGRPVQAPSRNLP
jgi:nitrate reductase assembly molybdenum cofactor insertion protein NarJ